MNGIPDIESQVFTECSEAVEAVDPDVDTIGSAEDIPERMPCVSIYEYSNQNDERAWETRNSEVRSTLIYQVDIYTNDVNGKKARSKKLRDAVAQYFYSIGFSRILSAPIPNFGRPDVYRYTMRFEASMNAVKETTRR